jgi:quercetin dioxygenase-like cupin family protein
MRWRNAAVVMLGFGMLLLRPGMSPAAARDPDYETTYERLSPELLLDNPRVRVQKFSLPPGAATGRHTHTGDALLVIIKGGVLTDASSGRSVLWHDGRVAWLAASAPPDAGARNAGNTPIELIWVAIKPWPPPPGKAAADADLHLNYPNIPGEDLFENDLIVVQRFSVPPGQWEGVHAHRPNMLYIHVKGGQWSTRTYSTPEHAYDPSPDGEVGWMDPFPLNAGHESRNAGTEPIDLIWITLKR